MTAPVHVHPKVERQLSALSRQANAPANAAGRAREIIRRLARGESPATSGRMRPKSDRRVKNCLKFDLGKGFRLICLREKGVIYVFFVGDHDSADTWLDHYTRKKPHKTDLSMDLLSMEPVRSNRPVCRNETGNAGASDEESRPEEIPQELLRRVFRGLCATG